MLTIPVASQVWLLWSAPLALIASTRRVEQVLFEGVKDNEKAVLSFLLRSKRVAAGGLLLICQ